MRRPDLDVPTEVLLSVIVPARNEAENLTPLLGEIADALAGQSFEIIIVDDASTDNSHDIIQAGKDAGLALRHLRHAQRRGQSAALRTGLLAARGALIATLDGDGQNDPANIPTMLTMLTTADPRTALITGERRQRTDSGGKRFASRFANRLRGRVLGDNIADSGCGLRLIRREIFLTLPFFDGWHRFLPALVLREGYLVKTIAITDRPRRFGRSHYGILDRGMRGILDLFGVWWLKRRFPGRADTSELP